VAGASRAVIDQAIPDSAPECRCSPIIADVDVTVRPCVHSTLLHVSCTRYRGTNPFDKDRGAGND